MANTFGRLLRDPLVVGLLALDATNQLARTYNQPRPPDPNDVSFMNRALIAGKPVESIPAERGLFGKLGQGMGLLSDTTKATPRQMDLETLALREQGQEQNKKTEDFLKLGSSLGSENVNKLAKGPFGAAIGGNIPELGPTPAEQRTKAIEERNKTAVEIKPAYDIEGKKPTIMVPVSKTGATEPPAGRTFSKPSTRETIPEGAARTEAYTTARLNATEKNLEARDVTEDVKGGQWYDMKTYQPAKSGTTVAQAIKQPNKFRKVTPQAARAIQAVPKMDEELKDLARIANEKLVSTAGMSQIAAQIKITENWAALKRAAFAGADPDAFQLVNYARLEGIQTIYDLQHRYPNKFEIEPAEKLFSPFQSKESYLNNIRKTRERVHSGVDGITTEGTIDVKKDEAATALDSWKEEVAPTESPEEPPTINVESPDVIDNSDLKE